MTILLDTGVLFAFLNRDDVHHPEARGLLSQVQAGAFGSPYVLEYVVAELFNLIRRRTRNASLERAAKALLPLPIPSLRGLDILPVGSALLDDVFATFERHRARGVSFTDAAQLVVLEAGELDTLATFDRGLRGLAPIVP